MVLANRIEAGEDTAPWDRASAHPRLPFPGGRDALAGTRREPSDRRQRIRQVELHSFLQHAELDAEVPPACGVRQQAGRGGRSTARRKRPDATAGRRDPGYAHPWAATTTGSRWLPRIPTSCCSRRSRSAYNSDGAPTEAPWNHLGVGHREALIVEAGQARDEGRAPKANRQAARIVTHLLRNCTAYQFHNTGSGSRPQEDVRCHRSRAPASGRRQSGSYSPLA